MPKLKFAPKHIFEQMLEWGVIPTFDLVVEYEKQGIIIAKRKISPYQNQWALPGLRMFKGENIDDALKRIAYKEIGLRINPSKKVFLGQYVGKFKTEHNRQDLSTGYYVKVSSNQKIKLNKSHFSEFKLINSKAEIPSNIGAMYHFYLDRYFSLKKLE